MKRIVNFFATTKKGEMVLTTISAAILISVVVGLCISAPIFWMGVKEFQGTWMNQMGPYFFYPFCVAVFCMCTIYAPYLSFIGRSEALSKHEHATTRRLMKGMAALLAIIPGGILFGFVAKALYIPCGPHNIIGMIIFGLLYLRATSFILRKPFSIVQEFAPLV